MGNGSNVMKRNSVVAGLTFAACLSVAGICRSAPLSEQEFEEKHKDEQHIYLLYETDIRVREDWSYVEKVHKSVKILKEEAKDMGEIPLPYVNGSTTITGIKAHSITPDGVKHRYSQIQDISRYDQFPKYSDTRIKIITVPQVTVGSVLEYEATVTRRKPQIPNTFWECTNFNFEVPAKRIVYSLTFPEKLNIQYKEFALTNKPEITRNKGLVTYRWQIDDWTPVMDNEEYLPPPQPESFRETVEFSSIKDWRDFDLWYNGRVDKNLVITPEIEAAAAAAVAGKSALRDKTRAILEYVQADFRYVSMAFGANRLEPRPTDEVFRNRYGDCKDLSLLTKAMLQTVGVRADMCLFNTEHSISDPQFDLPLPLLFNHMVLLVRDPEGGDFFVDPLLKGYDLGQYPREYQAAYTFVITSDGGNFQRLPVFDESLLASHDLRTVAIEPDGSATIETEGTIQLDDAVGLRQEVNAMNNEEKEKFFEEFSQSLAGNGQTLSHSIEGLDRKYGLLISRYKVKRKNYYSVTDGLLVIDLTTFGNIDSFNSKERRHPIYNPTNAREELTTVYRVPAGFRISYVPPDIDLDSGMFNFRRTCVVKGDEVHVSQAKIFRRVQLPVEDFAKVKDFYANLGANTQQRIVLKQEEGKSGQ